MLHGRTTLSKFIIEEQRKLEGGAELIALVNDIQTACKYIGTAVARGALAGARGSTGVVNVQGQDRDFDVRGGLGTQVTIDQLQPAVLQFPRNERIAVPSWNPNMAKRLNGITNSDIPFSLFAIF